MPAGVGYGAFQEPEGIPDARGATFRDDVPAGMDVGELLRSGKIGAEELLQLVAMLAGMGQAPQSGGQSQGGAPVEQAFMGGGPGV